MASSEDLSKSMKL